MRVCRAKVLRGWFRCLVYGAMNVPLEDVMSEILQDMESIDQRRVEVFSLVHK